MTNYPSTKRIKPASFNPMNPNPPLPLTHKSPSCTSLYTFTTNTLTISPRHTITITMSDAGRQSFTDKASAALTVRTAPFIPTPILTLRSFQPDSQKSTTSQVGDSIKSTMDSVASTVQPNVRPFPTPLSLPHCPSQNDKSATQKVGDAVSGNANQNQVPLLDSVLTLLHAHFARCRSRSLTRPRTPSVTASPRSKCDYS